MATSVLDIRKKTASERAKGTQEKLRGDHITMMEMLQKAMDSNEQLQKELDKLKSNLPTDSPQIDSDAELVSSLKDSVSSLTDQVAKMEKERQCLINIYDDKLQVVFAVAISFQLCR